LWYLYYLLGLSYDVFGFLIGVLFYFWVIKSTSRRFATAANTPITSRLVYHCACFTPPSNYSNLRRRCSPILVTLIARLLLTHLNNSFHSSCSTLIMMITFHRRLFAQIIREAHFFELLQHLKILLLFNFIFFWSAFPLRNWAIRFFMPAAFLGCLNCIFIRNFFDRRRLFLP